MTDFNQRRSFVMAVILSIRRSVLPTLGKDARPMRHGFDCGTESFTDIVMIAGQLWQQETPVDLPISPCI
jgi:hypothetical protein